MTSPRSLAADAQRLQQSMGNHGAGLLLQAKLTVGPAGDRYEREADCIAQRVMTTLSVPQAGQRGGGEQSRSDAHATVRRATLASIRGRAQPAGEQRADGANAVAPMTARISSIQRDDTSVERTSGAFFHGREGGDVQPGMARTIENTRGSGQPLHDGVRAAMEHGFGADFSHVRVHNGSQSDALNRSLNSRAFTTGGDIFFRSGEYNPESRAGQELIAHELTHTVQQGAEASKPKAIQPKIIQPQSHLDDRSIVQRAWKLNSLVKKYQSLKGQITGRSEKKEDQNRPEQNDEVLRASIALKISTDVRSEGNSDENGHAWIELEPMKPWPEIEKSGLLSKMSLATQKGLQTHQWHPIGFYPAGKKRSTVFSIPGKIVDPEKPSMTQNTTATKSFSLNSAQAGKLFDYVKDKRTAKYNFMRYNCTNFAVGALDAAGFTANEFLGRVTSKRVTSPNKVYKRLFERAALGDKSIKIAKTLGPKQKHVRGLETKALQEASGVKGDLLGATQDVNYVSEAAKSFSWTIHTRLKQQPNLTVKDLSGWGWLVKDLTAHDKRNLEASYPQVFDQTIDQAFGLKQEQELSPEETPSTNVANNPKEEALNDGIQNDFDMGNQETNFFDDLEETSSNNDTGENDTGENLDINFFDDETN